MKLHSLSLHELDALVGSIKAEMERRERIRVACDFVDKHVGDLAAEVAGVVDWEDMPDRGHLPGQVVTFEGQQFRNVSRRCTHVPPGETLVVWELVEPEPEVPDEPEVPEVTEEPEVPEEPEPDEPEAEPEPEDPDEPETPEPVE